MAAICIPHAATVNICLDCLYSFTSCFCLGVRVFRRMMPTTLENLNFYKISHNKVNCKSLYFRDGYLVEFVGFFYFSSQLSITENDSSFLEHHRLFLIERPVIEVPFSYSQLNHIHTHTLIYTYICKQNEFYKLLLSP